MGCVMEGAFEGERIRGRAAAIGHRLTAETLHWSEVNHLLNPRLDITYLLNPRLDII